MEGPVESRRRSGHHKIPWQERLRLAWEMPRLRRRERNERLAIFFVLLALVVYVLLAPALNRSTPGGDGVSDKGAPAARPRAPLKERR